MKTVEANKPLNTESNKARIYRATKSENKKRFTHWIQGIVVYALGILYFFPILYMFLTAFKSEYDVTPPKLLFQPTLETFREVLDNPRVWDHFGNSAFLVIAATLISLLLGVPAAYALVFGKFKKSTTPSNIYLWFITTILLPPVAVIIPISVAFKSTGLLGSLWGLLLIYTGFHVPLVIWMVRSFFADIPKDIMEASEIDGCTKLEGFFKIVLPLARTGIISAALLVTIFLWNEFFFAFNLTNNNTATLPVFMSRFTTQEGLFWAKLSASSTLVVLPALIMGWISQKSLVQGLTMGAVKG